MLQINSKIKDDFQVVLLPSYFVGHPVDSESLHWKVWKDTLYVWWAEITSKWMAITHAAKYFV